MNRKAKIKNAFTLAEVLITLGVIGVVAAVTMPTLLTNIQDRVRQEQVRTVKYKLTKATDTMNSLGKIGPYGIEAGNVDATEKFVNELKKHMSIAKICKNDELDKCWPAGTVNGYLGTNSTTLSEISTSSLTTGSTLNALALSTKDTRTVGIVTGDGVSIIMVYSPVCQALDETKNYTWSVENGKPITNATTNCISAIFDINGAKGPNKIGQDVRTLNSLFGAANLTTVAATYDECKALQKKYNIQWCHTENDDHWVGAIKRCDQLGLHLPTLSTLANVANARYGTTKIGTYTLYSGPTHDASIYPQGCRAWWIQTDKSTWRVDGSDAILCGESTTTDGNSGFSIPDGSYWSSSEYSSSDAYLRNIRSAHSYWNRCIRTFDWLTALCVGD